MKKIHHFTDECYLQEIIQDGQILTERDVLNKHLHLCHSPLMDKDWKQQILIFAPTMKFSCRLIGSYVWFTENPEGVATATGNDVRFDFDANDIGAVRWITVMKGLNSSKQKRYLKSLMDTAISSGDDPKDWWVTRQPVSLDNCKGYVDIANPHKGYVQVANPNILNSHNPCYRDTNSALENY